MYPILSNSFLLDKKVVFVRVVSGHLKKKIASNLIKSMKHKHYIYIFILFPGLQLYKFWV